MIIFLNVHSRTKRPVINNGRAGGGGGRCVRKGGGFNYFCLNWGRPQTEKICDKGRPQFFNTFLLIFKTFKPFLVPIIVVSTFYVYAVHHRSGVNNNHFEYWSPVLVPLLILLQKM